MVPFLPVDFRVSHFLSPQSSVSSPLTARGLGKISGVFTASNLLLEVLLMYGSEL